MSKDEMKRLKIPDPKDVEKLKINLRKLAGKKGWKLDLVDTPRGREFRGIIEAEDADEETSKEGKDGKVKGGKVEKDSRAEKSTLKGNGKGMGSDEQEPIEDVAYEEEGTEDEEAYEGTEEVYKDEL